MTPRWWRPPDPPLRFGVALAAASGLAGAILAGWLLTDRLGLGIAYPAVSAGVFIGAMALAVGAARAGHPFPRFGPANLVTTLRLLLVALTAGLVVAAGNGRAAWLAVAATTLAAALDGIDGWLARRSGLSSEFGARFDMETDALLILILAVLVWTFGKAGSWVLACGFMRYGFVAAGTVMPWMARPLAATVRGKTVAVLQLAGLGAALAPPVTPPASTAAAAIALASLTWSFAVDIGRLWRARDGRRTA